MSPSPFITRVRLGRFKSIVACDVELGPLAILIGPNASGKSNFLDALSLISEALSTSLERAIGARGGSHRVLHQPASATDRVEIALDLRLAADRRATYALSLAPGGNDDWRVAREECHVGDPSPDAEAAHHFAVEEGELRSCTIAGAPVAAADSLYLTRASNLEEFLPVFRGLSRMVFYDFHPDRIPRLAERDRGLSLAGDARNLGSVLRHLQAEAPRAFGRIAEYLRVVLPTLERLEAVSIGDFDTVDFFLRVADHSERFPLPSMSDGTLNALAVLVAALQPATDPASAVSLVGIEEPEKALHPAASAMLADAFLEASRNVQVIVTSHSPDLLDHDELGVDQLIAVMADQGVTQLGKLDEFARSVLRDGLTTPGDLLRQNHLWPEPAVAATGTQ